MSKQRRENTFKVSYILLFNNKINVKKKTESDYIFLELRVPFYRVVKTISSKKRMIKVETYEPC